MTGIKKYDEKVLREKSSSRGAFCGTHTLVVGLDAFPVEDFLFGRVPLFQRGRSPAA